MSNDNSSGSADDARQLVAEISTYIAQAKAALEKGVLIDLAGLDSQIRLLCEEIIRMPVGESRPFREVLAELSDELGLLRDALGAARSDVQDQLEALNMRQKAAHAYKKTEVAEVRDAKNKPANDE